MLPSSWRVKIEGDILWACNWDPSIVIDVVIPLLKAKSLFSTSTSISKVLVVISAEGEINEILPIFLTPFEFSIVALVFNLTLLISNSDK